MLSLLSSHIVSPTEVPFERKVRVNGEVGRERELPLGRDHIACEERRKEGGGGGGTHMNTCNI